MQQDTIIKLIKQSIQNFEETKDVEHLNDIIQIIFEYKKASNGSCWLMWKISCFKYNTTILQMKERRIHGS